MDFSFYVIVNNLQIAKTQYRIVRKDKINFYTHKFVKFMKIFSLKIFRLCGI